MITLESSWFGDNRWRVVAEILDADPFAVRARIESLWLHCFTSRRDVLSSQEIKLHASWRKSDFAQAMVEGDLAEPFQGGFRIKGVAQRMEWLLKKDDERLARLANSSKGGKISAQRQRDAKGRLLPSGVQVDLDKSPSELQVNSKCGPAESSLVIASAIASAPETASAQQNLILKTPPSSHEKARAHAIDPRNYPYGGDGGGDPWDAIDQSALLGIGMAQINKPGLAKVKAIGTLWADDVARSIAYFVFDVVKNRKFREVLYPTGILMSYLLKSGYPKPRNFIELVPRAEGAS